MKDSKNMMYPCEELVDNLNKLNEELSQSGEDQKLDQKQLIKNATQKAMRTKRKSKNPNKAQKP